MPEEWADDEDDQDAPQNEIIPNADDNDDETD